MSQLSNTPLIFDERLRYSIPEASQLLRQSRAKTYTDIKAGTLRVIKDCKRTYVPGTKIRRRCAVDQPAA
jgi:hypothetical protein